MGIGYAIGAQPHMNESIAFLQSARGELQAATPNKGVIGSAPSFQLTRL
jgi:hypothetical protein